VGFVKFDYDDPEQKKVGVNALHNFLMGQIAKANEMRAQAQKTAKTTETPS
jgi:hypothetical protein